MSPTLLSALCAAVLVGLATALTWPARPGGAPPGPRLAGVVTAVVVLTLVVVRPPSGVAVPGLLGLAALAGVCGLLRRRAQRRAAEHTRSRVLLFCDELAAALASGLPAPTALEAAADAWPAAGEVTAAARLGGSVPPALRRLAERPGAGDLRLVAAAWQVAQRSGASLAGVLAAITEGLREQQRTRRLVASELASARATARLMAALPVATLLLGSGTGGSPVRFLFTTGPGMACLAGGIGLALVGLWWIEGIAEAVDREAR